LFSTVVPEERVFRQYSNHSGGNRRPRFAYMGVMFRTHPISAKEKRSVESAVTRRHQSRRTSHNRHAYRAGQTSRPLRIYERMKSRVNESSCGTLNVITSDKIQLCSSRKVDIAQRLEFEYGECCWGRSPASPQMTTQWCRLDTGYSQPAR